EPEQRTVEDPEEDATHSGQTEHGDDRLTRSHRHVGLLESRVHTREQAATSDFLLGGLGEAVEQRDLVEKALLLRLLRPRASPIGLETLGEAIGLFVALPAEQDH